MMDNDNVMPPTGKGKHQLGIPKHRAGGPRSVAALKKLNFDPITKLVESYHQLTDEIVYQQKRRAGQIIEMNSKGHVREFNMETLLRLYEQRDTISDKLLRYGYGRVSETVNVNPGVTPSLIVNLTPKGEQYRINDFTDVSPDEEEDEE